MEHLQDENFEKEAYKPLKKRPIKRKGLGNVKQKIKNRIRYRKNKFKIKMYNKKYRQRNKMLLRRKRQLRNKRKAK